MADDARRGGMSRRDKIHSKGPHPPDTPRGDPKRPAQLVAVDGVNGTAVMATARSLATGVRRQNLGISMWDASGIFGEVVVAEDSAGPPTARTLLLLYAADLAFRLRWEIKPALDAGQRVVAVPYVDTAIAFGRAAGLDAEWLADMFSFAPTPGERRLVTAAAAKAISERKGFVEFGCQQLGAAHAGRPRRLLIRRTSAYLRSMSVQRPLARTKKASRTEGWRLASATGRPGS